MQKLRTLIMSLIISPLLLMAPLALTAPVAADSVSDACAGIGLAGGDCGSHASDNKVNNLVKTVLNILTWVAGIAAVIMIILAGFRYITSGGDSSKVSGAKSALTYAIVGIIVVALAQVIVHLALSTAKG